MIPQNENFDLYAKAPIGLIESDTIGALAKVIWLRLAIFAGKNGRCNPSIEQIAFAVGASKAAVKRKLNELEKAGFIERIRATLSEQLGKHTPTSYIFLKHPDVDQPAKRYSRDAVAQNDTHADCGSSKRATKTFRENKKRKQTNRGRDRKPGRTCFRGRGCCCF